MLTQRIEQCEPRAAPLVRRLLAISYDAMLVAALLMAASFLLLPWGFLEQTPWGQKAYQAYLLAIVASFFIYFWRRGGQTLGMRAWRLQAVSQDGRPLTMKQAVIRWCLALITYTCLGLGFWALVVLGRTLPELGSQTVTLYLKPTHTTKQQKQARIRKKQR